MKWKKLVSNLVYGDSEQSPNYQALAENIETFGKIGAALLGLFYVVGLVVFSLYHSKLHIRSIELFRVRYLLVGFYYFLFLFLHLFFQYRNIKRVWLKVIYFIVLLWLLVFFNDVNNTYFSYLFSIWTTGSSYFQFEPAQITVIIGNLSVLVGTALIAPIVFSLSIFLFKLKTKKKIVRVFAFILLFFSFQFNYSVFTQSVFPNIPEALGGGQAPIVNIVFSDDVPYSVTHNFDISGRAQGYLGPYYYAQLIYMDDDSVFLKEAFWYSNQVYELKRDQIEMLRFTEFNPVEMGQPLTLP